MGNSCERSRSIGKCGAYFFTLKIFRARHSTRKIKFLARPLPYAYIGYEGQAVEKV